MTPLHRSKLSFHAAPVACLAGAVVLLSTLGAQAHLTYGGGTPAARNFGTFSGLTSASASINNQTATGNFGWADAADGVLGDSHKGRAFRFTLQNEASVNFVVSANPTATGTSVGGLVPGYSIYAGLVAVAPFTAPQIDSDHDGSLASIAWQEFYEAANSQTLGLSDGNWNAIGDFKIGGDGDVAGDFAQLSSLTYKASAAAVGGANTISGTFTLPAGDYTIIIGGNDIANKSDPVESVKAFGIAATLNVSSVTPVPEPQTYALLAMGAGVIGMAVRRRRSRG